MEATISAVQEARRIRNSRKNIVPFKIKIKPNKIEAMGLWPGWPLAIAVALFTQDARHQQNLVLARAIESMGEGNYDSIMHFESLLASMGILQAHNKEDKPYSGAWSLTYAYSDPEAFYGMLQDSVLQIISDHGGSITFPPFILTANDAKYQSR